MRATFVAAIVSVLVSRNVRGRETGLVQIQGLGSLGTMFVIDMAAPHIGTWIRGVGPPSESAGEFRSASSAARRQSPDHHRQALGNNLAFRWASIASSTQFRSLISLLYYNTSSRGGGRQSSITHGQGIDKVNRLLLRYGRRLDMVLPCPMPWLDLCKDLVTPS